MLDVVARNLIKLRPDIFASIAADKLEKELGPRGIGPKASPEAYSHNLIGLEQERGTPGTFDRNSKKHIVSVPQRKIKAGSDTQVFLDSIKNIGTSSSEQQEQLRAYKRAQRAKKLRDLSLDLQQVEQRKKLRKQVKSSPQPDFSTGQIMNRGRGRSRRGRGRNGNRTADRTSTVVRPAPVARSIVFRQPFVRAQSTFIDKEEVISEIRSLGTAFSLYSFSINPGLANVFPWASITASAFEYYQFESLSFIFTTACSTTTPGIIQMACDFDNQDTAPSSLILMSQMKPAVRANPYQPSLIWNCPRSQLVLHNNGKLLVRTGSFQGDKNLNDLGILYFATQETGALLLGLLSVRYRIRLFGQQESPNPISGQFNATIAALVPFNSARVVVAGTPPYFLFNPSSPTNSIIIGASGHYLVHWAVTGATTLTAMDMGSTNCNITIVSSTIINAAATQGTMLAEVVVPDNDQLAPASVQFVLTGSSVAGSTTVRIASYNTDLN
jgi:hypothetical protein